MSISAAAMRGLKRQAGNFVREEAKDVVESFGWGLDSRSLLRKTFARIIVPQKRDRINGGGLVLRRDPLLIAYRRTYGRVFSPLITISRKENLVNHRTFFLPSDGGDDDEYRRGVEMLFRRSRVELNRMLKTGFNPLVQWRAQLFAYTLNPRSELEDYVRDPRPPEYKSPPRFIVPVNKTLKQIVAGEKLTPGEEIRILRRQGKPVLMKTYRTYWSVPLDPSHTYYRLSRIVGLPIEDEIAARLPPRFVRMGQLIFTFISSKHHDVQEKEKKSSRRR